MNVKNRLRLIVAVAAIGILALSAAWLKTMYSSLLAAKKEQVMRLVAVPYSIVVREHELETRGIISRDEAQRRAIESLKILRYDGDNYFWINDMHPTMVMHPMRPDLDGTDLSTYRDPDGKALFNEMVRTVKTNGSGFVFYRWTKPEKPSKAPVPKVSFVRGFEPWGWIIGTGVYIDDIQTAWRADAVVAGGLGLGCLVVLLVVATSLSHSIFKRLDRLMSDMGRVARGDLSFSERA
jgi:methyl-accepting chemotaxis protein